MKRAAFALAATVLLLARPASALEINSFTLDNGLRVLHVERDNLPMAAATLLVRAGNLHEPARLAGLTNLTALLLNEGTKARTSSEISSEVEFIGAELGAKGGRDYSTVSLRVLKKDLDKGFELFSDIVTAPVFPEAELVRKRGLIKGRLKRKSEEPGFIAREAFMARVFGEHPYGRQVEGSPETLDLIARDDVRRFHAAHYLPNNSILTVVGDVTDAELRALLDKYFGPSVWKKAELRAPGRKAEPPEPAESAVRIQRPVTQANILMGHMGVRRTNPDYYAITVMNYILGGGGFASRLMSRVRDDLGLAYDVYSFFMPYAEPGFFRMGVQTKNESAKTAIAELRAQVRKIRTGEVADTELDEARSYLTGSFPRRLDTMRKVADFLAAVEFYGLGHDYIEKYPGFINSVTKADVLRVAREYLDEKNMVLVIVADLQSAGFSK